MQMGIADAAVAGVTDRIALLKHKLRAFGIKLNIVAFIALLFSFDIDLNIFMKSVKMPIKSDLARIQRQIKRTAITEWRNANARYVAVAYGDYWKASDALRFDVNSCMKPTAARLGKGGTEQA